MHLGVSLNHNECRLNRHLTGTGITNPLVHNCPLNGRFNMGISRGNGTRQRPALEILWATSNVSRVLGGPGWNRTMAEDKQSNQSRILFK